MTVTLDPTVLLETIPGAKRLFEVKRRFHFGVDGRSGFVEQGEVTDLASTPLDVNVAEPWILRAAVVHDEYCQYVGSPPNGPTLTRREVNGMFREMMKFCGASWWQRWRAWLAVEWWTASHWNLPEAKARRANLRARVRIAAMVNRRLVDER